jgi:TolB protein
MIVLTQCDTQTSWDDPDDLFNSIVSIDPDDPFDPIVLIDPDNPVDPIIPIDPIDSYSAIAFIARITENSADWSLCVMDKSGNGKRKIINHTVACQKPVRSHSGTQLLFTAVKFDSRPGADNSVISSAEFDLYIVNTDGTGLTRIDHTKAGRFGSVDWAPDDRQIIYVKYSGASWEKSDLILYNKVNKTHQMIPTEGNICSPKFSPDGTKIAYCATVESDTLFVHSYRNHHIYKMDVKGSRNQLIIRDASSPKWSPQGDKISFLSSGKDGSCQISVADADGRNQKQLTTSVSPGWWDTGFPRNGNCDPQWTTDGKQIVYVSHENEKPEIFIMNADGSKKTRLSKAAYRDDSPEITPDGKSILFSSVREDMTGEVNPGIYMMTLDGKEQRVLSKTGINPVACR